MTPRRRAYLLALVLVALVIGFYVVGTCGLSDAELEPAAIITLA